MKISERLYNQESIEDQAERLCEEYEEKTFNNVEYRIWRFEDGSQLTVGSNGYIGSEH